MGEHRGYIDWEYGQLHIRQWGERSERKSSIVCLAPSPFSSVAYKTLAPLLADKHHVISMDYPGFGNSTALPDWPSISDYARAVLAVTSALSLDNPVVLLGFHSGTLVAVETALLAPAHVERLILIDIPYFEDRIRQDHLAEKSVETPITTDMSMLEKHWRHCVENCDGLIPLPRAYENFVDLINAGEGLNATFRAAFSYDCHRALPKIEVPTTFIATQAGLHDETTRAAAVTSGAELVRLPEIKIAVLDKGADLIARTVKSIMIAT